MWSGNGSQRQYFELVWPQMADHVSRIKTTNIFVRPWEFTTLGHVSHPMLCLHSRIRKSAAAFKPRRRSAYAMILTSFPRAPISISRANSSARSSIEPDGGTVAVMTSVPCSSSASLIPRQYWTPGKNRPARRNSSKPRRP